MNGTTASFDRESVTIWGDSIAKGVGWNSERKRHMTLPVTAAAVVEKELGIQIENRSRFGFTAPRGLALIEQDLEKGTDCQAALLEFGGNDCDFRWSEIAQNPEAEHNPATMPQVFYRTMCRMVERLKQANIRPILMTLPPIDADRYFKFIVGDQLNAKNILKWLGDTQQIYRFQEMYSNMIQKVAAKMDARLIDVRSYCLCNHHMKELLCEDGIHLNSDGQIFVGNTIAGILRQEA